MILNCFVIECKSMLAAPLLYLYLIYHFLQAIFLLIVKLALLRHLLEKKIMYLI